MQQLIARLPNILSKDTSTTPWSDALRCPYQLDVACSMNDYYRTYDGRCNNLKNPLWGSSHQPLVRFLPPDYADGKICLKILISAWQNTRTKDKENNLFVLEAAAHLWQFDFNVPVRHVLPSFHTHLLNCSASYLIKLQPTDYFASVKGSGGGIMFFECFRSVWCPYTVNAITWKVR